MKVQERSIEIARALMPETFSDKRCYHFSLIFRGSKLLSIGQNSNKTHARNRFNKKWDDSKTCSELNCFIKAKNLISDLDWSKLTMVNVRIGRDLTVMNSAPCIFCQNLIAYLGVRKLFYSTNEGIFKKY